MRTYLINTIGQIPTTNRQLDYKSTLKTNEWVVFNDKQGDVEKFLFLDGDKLLVSLNGKTSYSKWQYMKVNSSLVIDDGDNKYMFKIIVCNKDIILLNVDSTDSYSFLINTKSEALENCTYKEIQWYLKKICGVDIFNNEQRIEYENVQRKLKFKEEEESNARLVQNITRSAIVFAIIIGLILVVGTIGTIISNYQEKQIEEKEYNRTHPKMATTKLENRHAVDLGLSVKWATCDVGANQPTKRGNKYGWGDTSGIRYTTTIGRYGYEQVIIQGDGEDDYLYAYPTRRKGIGVPRSIVNTQYDIARQCWGDGWRMPTEAEARELIDSCKFIHHDRYIEAIGPNGNSVLFPSGALPDDCEYATGELDTMPHTNPYGVGAFSFVRSFIIKHEVKMSVASRKDHLQIRAVHD